MTKLEVFNLFLTDDIVSFIVQQSNLYAEQVLGEKYTDWKISPLELRAYFGFMVLMGLNQNQLLATTGGGTPSCDMLQ